VKAGREKVGNVASLQSHEQVQNIETRPRWKENVAKCVKNAQNVSTEERESFSHDRQNVTS